MGRIMYFVALIIMLAAAALVAVGQLGYLQGNPPDDLGVKDGKLKRPSKTENSVSSQAGLWANHPMQAYAEIKPLRVQGDGAATMAKVAAALKAMPRTEIVSQDANYIYARATTAVLKFTDDVEFMLDAKAGVVHVRSASRLGRKDFGVNRARIESVRAAVGQ